jgi:recombination protein RecR
MNSIDKLTEIFRSFPGIGPRQARRFVYFLLSKKNGYLDDLAKTILEARKDVNTCESCFRYFVSNGTGSTLCSICRNSSRNWSQLLVIAKDVDFESVEKSGAYQGIYFILGGTIPILEKSPETKIRIHELLQTVEKRAKDSILKEIIISMSLNPEGENTEQYIKKALKPFVEKYGLKLSIPGKGLSTGTELEYSDSETIKNALRNRTE